MNEENRVPTNEEVIEELTKDLQSHQIEPEPSSSTATENSNDLPFDDFIDDEKLTIDQSKLNEEEKLELKAKSGDLKVQGNDTFKSGEYLESIRIYTEALRSCPLEYKADRAILFCNRAASKIQLERKDTAISDCTRAIELNADYVRAYLRRAKLYEDTDKLDESLEDYKQVLRLDEGNAEALKASVRLPPLIDERNEKMKAEMMGKLKDLGNMILRPFGLSTDNFQLQQDSDSGGYKINFQQNPAK